MAQYKGVRQEGNTSATPSSDYYDQQRPAGPRFKSGPTPYLDFARSQDICLSILLFISVIFPESSLSANAISS